MKSLEAPDIHYLRAAQGWLELGNHREARGELEQLSPRLALHPEVMEVRWQIYAKSHKWQECLDIASAQVQLEPSRVSGWIHRSYTLHEMKRTQEASDALLPAADLFPREWLVRYNLACYACQLGRLTETRKWLMNAFDLGNSKEIRLMALADPDLKPFWPQAGDL